MGYRRDENVRHAKSGMRIAYGRFILNEIRSCSPHSMECFSKASLGESCVLYQTKRVNDIDCMVDLRCETGLVVTHTVGFTRLMLPSANNDM